MAKPGEINHPADKSETIENADFRRWIEGVPYEIAFWKSYYANKRRRADLMRWSQYDSEVHLDCFDFGQFIKQRRAVTNSAPVVLDVGCGMSYAFGNIANGEKIDVQYIDTLATFYNSILTRYQIDRPRIVFGMMENLTATCYDRPADFIHIRNALDHSSNPIEGIRQALACLQIGGVLYLTHFENEAENEAYRGFHQYNLTEWDGKLIVWNNKGANHCVNEIFGDYADIQTLRTKENRIVAIFTKRRQFEDIEALLCETSGRVGRMTMQTIEYFQNPGKSLKYQWCNLYSNIGHFIAKAIPPSVLKRLKRLISRTKTKP